MSSSISYFKSAKNQYVHIWISHNKVENNSSNCKLKKQTIPLVSQSTKRLFFTLIGIKPLKVLAYLEMELRTNMYSFVTEKIISCLIDAKTRREKIMKTNKGRSGLQWILNKIDKWLKNWNPFNLQMYLHIHLASKFQDF